MVSETIPVLQALALGAVCFSSQPGVIMYWRGTDKAERIVFNTMLDQLNVWRLLEASTDKRRGSYFWNVHRVPSCPNSALSFAFAPTSSSDGCSKSGARATSLARSAHDLGCSSRSKERSALHPPPSCSRTAVQARSRARPAVSHSRRGNSCCQVSANEV